MFNSLVGLESSTYTELKVETIKDLNLADAFELLEAFSDHQEAVIFSLCQDEATIEYRQAIMKEFMTKPSMLEALSEHLERFEEFKYLNDNGVSRGSKLYYLIERLKIVEASVICLEEVYETLSDDTIKAEGLLKLKASVLKLMSEDLYKNMKVDMKKIRHIFSQIKSVEVSINMNTGMRPYEAQVTGVNSDNYLSPKAFHRVSEALDRTETFLGHKVKNYIPVFSVEKLDVDLLEEIEYSLRHHQDTIKTFLKTYSKVDSTPFLKLREEVSFYKASMTMVAFLQEAALPLCWPRVLGAEERKMSVKDGYNINLAGEMLKEGKLDQMVMNDVFMDAYCRLMIMTGSNRGGKTTYTQMVGQIQVLAQLGLPIPAREASLSLVDSIKTHFPLLESESLDHGRFGRECLSFKESYRGMTSQSLILMNESFSGTSHLESLQIADEVVRALKIKGSRVVFNTHLHELGMKISDYNEQIKNDCVSRSYVVGETTSEQIYKVYEAEPRGYSQAYEIAKTFGVTFDQLIDTIKGEVVK